MKLDGTIRRDETDPDKPAVEVELDGKKVTDSVVKELTAFKKLTVLHLSMTRVTDVGVKEIGSDFRSLT